MIIRTALLAAVIAGATATAAGHTSAMPQRPQHTAQSITVHGHWTIGVRNPDGTLAHRRELENSLESGGGGGALARILGMHDVVKGWQLALVDGDDRWGHIYQLMVAPAQPPPPNSSNDLVLSPAVEADGTMTLSGSVMASTGKMISGVESYLTYQRPGSAFYRFTAGALAQPVQVAAGQIVQVSVKFSFS